MTNKKFSQKKSLSKPYFEGSKDEFNRFLSGYSRNLVQRITRKYKAEIGKCEFCGLENEELDSAHIHGKERKLIINKIISKFCKNDIIKINLIEFENQLIKEHDPINEVIKILCKKCHVEYDNKNSKNNSGIKNEKRRKNEMKIGNYVKSTFEILNNSIKLSHKEIGNLQDLVYCKNTFIFLFLF